VYFKVNTLYWECISRWIHYTESVFQDEYIILRVYFKMNTLYWECISRWIHYSESVFRDEYIITGSLDCYFFSVFFSSLLSLTWEMIILARYKLWIVFELILLNISIELTCTSTYMNMIQISFEYYSKLYCSIMPKGWLLYRSRIVVTCGFLSACDYWRPDILSLIVPSSWTGKAVLSAIEKYQSLEL